MSRSVGFKRRRRDAARFRRALFEPLEDRSLLAATITVNSVLDTNVRDSALTLREAILINNRTLLVSSLTEAERTRVSGTPTDADTDTIAFNIPGNGVRSITLSTHLPWITDSAIIDGYTQPGTKPNTNAIDDPDTSKRGFNGTLVIELTATPGPPSLDGLTIVANNSTVRGLVINRLAKGIDIFGTGNVVEGNLIGTDASGMLDRGNITSGIVVSGPNNRIGGTSPSSRNIVSNNGFWGIQFKWVGGDETVNNVIQGNFIGTDASGTKGLGNEQSGIFLYQVENNSIGGIQAGARNIISDNGGMGIFFESSRSIHVLGNYIGVDVSGTKPLGNHGAGISIKGFSRNVIGGTSEEARNVISANLYGIIVSSELNTVQGNFIGTDSAGVLPLGNTLDGIALLNGNARSNRIGGESAGAGNRIAFNGRDGVRIEDDSFYNNFILSNSIFNNGGLGIELGPDGPTTNDVGDPDSGPNRLQNYPVLSSATNVGTTLSVQYAVPSTSTNSSYPLRVEFFKADPDGQEGHIFLGFDNYGLSEAGSVKTFAFTPTSPLGTGNRIVATATDSSGNTSEFSESITVQGTPCSFVVVNTNDSGAGSLREAINCANSTPGTDTITFAIPASDPRHFYYSNDFVARGVNSLSVTPTTVPADSIIRGADPDWAHSWFSIQIHSALPTIEGPVTIDGYSQLGSTPNRDGSELEGNAILRIELTEAPEAKGRGLSGLVINSSQSTVRGLAINRFDSHGIQIISDGNTVVGNYVGTGVSGTEALGNGGDGVQVSEASSNTIGGTNAAGRNVITRNLGSGIAFVRGATENVVQGNFISRNASGSVFASTTGAGVLIDESSENTVGGTAVGARNVISFNAHGVLIRGGGAHNNAVLGNFIGTDASGTRPFGNGSGVVIQDAHDNTIGGTTPSSRNVISGNVTNGVVIYGKTPGMAFNNVVKGNYIGPDVTGERAVEVEHFTDAALRIVGFGGAFDNIIGGPEAGAGNVISGNKAVGISIENDLSTGNIIQGNYVGVSASGALAMGNSLFGVAINRAHRNVVGGEGSAGNVISANGYSGVYLSESASDNLIQGNYIGTDVSGTESRGNVEDGVHIQGGAVKTTVRDNLISANGGAGIRIYRPETTGTVVIGNKVGTAADGVSPLGNALNGIEVTGPSGGLIGGADSNMVNVIAFNGGAGVLIAPFGGSIGTGTAIVRNSIFANGLLGIDLSSAAYSPDGISLNETGDEDFGVNKLQNFPEIISATLVKGQLKIAYRVPSNPSNAAYPLRVEFFKADVSGQEGQMFLGFDTYTSSSAEWTTEFFISPVEALGTGYKIVATATDADGNTSEFSPAIVLSLNQSPNARSDDATVSEDASLAVSAPGILENDLDSDTNDTKRVVAVTIGGQSAALGAAIALASGAVLTVNPDGSYRYDPNGKFESLGVGQTATDLFTYTMADGEGATSTATVTVMIEGVNDEPRVLLGGDLIVAEGVAIAAGGLFVDADASDSWTASVDYGDASGERVLALAADKGFLLQHAYVDDGEYLVTVKVRDGSQAVGSASFRVLVHNVDPQIVSWTGPAVGSRAQVLAFSGSFVDGGAADTHVATVDWGDGETSSAAVNRSGGVWLVSAQHNYRWGGLYEVRLKIADGDGGVAEQTANVLVAGARTYGEAFEIVGSPQRDKLKLTKVNNRTLVLMGNIGSRTIRQAFSYTGVERIVVHLGAGDDSLTVDAKIKVPLLVVGGEGNDSIKAGGGAAVLIGGLGADTLSGGSRSDLLIGGSTVFDERPEALVAILSEWGSGRPLSERSTNLRMGRGPVLEGTGVALNGDTVLDDGSIDRLLGGGELDWFWFDSRRDRVQDGRAQGRGRGDLMN
jgi:VCBS repeat-containing protein